MAEPPSITPSQPGTATDANSPPTEQYVIPFDHRPKSSPGEQIIFGATYTHATPSDFKLVYTSVGGHFGTQGSNVATKTYDGLSARNVYWFVDAAWDCKTAVTMKLQVKKKSDDSVVTTVDWTFGAKGTQPTTIAQK